MINLAAAIQFVTVHARLLDRRRLGHALGRVSAEEVLAALNAYRNPDGGYGWGLEADLRSETSQPGAALHVFETLAEIPEIKAHEARELCDWLLGVSNDDGGLPFAMPFTDTAGTAPWWTGPSTGDSSLQITAIVAAQAHRVADHDPVVGDHEWLARATKFCIRTSLESRNLGAYELGFALQLADRAGRRGMFPQDAIDHLLTLLPASGTMHVTGGTETEYLHLLDFSPWPDGPVRAAISPKLIEKDIERRINLQQPDGGWTVEFESASPAGALEWRGYVTVQHILMLAPDLARADSV
jgi:hypothetical protein